MIETREQRKRSSLLRRRRTAIIISLLSAAVLIVAAVLIFNYFNNVLPFKDADGTKYYIKKVDGIYAMYDKSGNILRTQKAIDSSEVYFVTDSGTTVRVNPETGETRIYSISADLFAEIQARGETVDHDFITVFKGLEDKAIMSVEVDNQHGNFTLLRYSLDKMAPDASASFVLKQSPFSTIDRDRLSYFTYFAGNVMVVDRINDPIKDSHGEYSEYGLVAGRRRDANGNEYECEYRPTTVTVTGVSGEKHTVIYGDMLIDGSGYYLQYADANGVRRDQVYVYRPTDMTETNGTNMDNTLFAPAKSLVTPQLIYPVTANNYNEVTDFSLKKKNADNGKLEEMICFSYSDLEDRTGTILGNHPYVFSESSSLGSYYPNYDSIDLCLQRLMKPKITDIAVLAPKSADKVKYGLMREKVNSDGTVEYVYDPDYLITFDRFIENDQGDRIPVTQTIYIAKDPSSTANYYTFTEMRFKEATDATAIKGIAFDSICAVSEETMSFLQWDRYDWIYHNFVSVGIAYVSRVELSSPDYSAVFDLNRGSAADSKGSTLSVVASDSKGNSATTFSSYVFKDTAGNIYNVTPTEIKGYSPSGKEVKPSSRHYEYNALGQQVQVVDNYINSANGDLVYVTKDEVIIHHLNGTEDRYLRYHTTVFRSLFAGINNTAIVDSYSMTEEEEKALVENDANRLATVKITTTDGEVRQYDFYRLTERKAYLLVNGKGGFYVQSTKVQKYFSDAAKFFAGAEIDENAYN